MSRCVHLLCWLSIGCAPLGCSTDIPEVPPPSAGSSSGTSGVTTFGTAVDPTVVGSTASDETDSDPTTSSLDTTATDTTAGTTDHTIYEIQDGTVGAGVAVDVQGVIVTAVASDGAFVQEPEGGMFSGVFMRRGGVDVAIGQRVDIIGTTAELNGRTEIDARRGRLIPVRGIEPVEATVVSMAQLQARAADAWEGVLVRTDGRLHVAELLADAKFELADADDAAVVVDDRVHAVADWPRLYPDFGVNAGFSGVQGPLDLIDGRYALVPRNTMDLMGYAPPPLVELSVDDLQPGELLITEIMFDPTCPTDVCEWIEVFNDSGLAVDLAGLRVQDSAMATEGVVVDSVVVADGDYAVLARGDATDWPYANPPTAYYGSGPGLNNTGDLVVILNNNEPVDLTATYVDEGPADDGYSWKLDPASIDATLNDDVANWCFSTTVFDAPAGVDEYGSPGAPNEAACASL